MQKWLQFPQSRGLQGWGWESQCVKEMEPCSTNGGAAATSSGKMKVKGSLLLHSSQGPCMLASDKQKVYWILKRFLSCFWLWLISLCMRAQLLSHVQLFVTTWTGPTGSSVLGILQARILEWVAISSFRGSSWPRDQTYVSCSSCCGRQIPYHWAIWEAWIETWWILNIEPITHFRYSLGHTHGED